MKRIFDLLISITLIILLSPLMLIVAVAIRIESSGPVFFKQKRRGKGFDLFTMWKFRSLRYNEPDPHSKYEMLSSDPRITSVGNFIRKTSIDELPQLFNVVAGSMSIVGPRPLVEWESQLANQKYSERFSVKPGITGLSQLAGRNTIDFDTRCMYDVEYVRRRSIFMDILLLLKTPYVLMTEREIYPTEISRNKQTDGIT